MGSDEFTVHQWFISQTTFWPVLEISVRRNSFRRRSESFSLRYNFPTKLNIVTDEEFTYFRAAEVVASKSNAGNRNTISRHYYGEKFLSNQESTLL